MADHARLAATASRLILANGRELTFRGRVALRDSTKPWLGKAEASSVGTAVGVFAEYSSREIDGTLIRAGDRRVYIGADVAFSPSEELELVDGGVVWAVVSAKAIQPGPTIIVWDLQVRA